MRILFLTSAHNSLSQRLWIELGTRGHDVSVCIAANAEAMISAALGQQPDLIIAPMLKIAIPQDVWSRYLCLIVHPGIKGDRGPSSLDWAIARRETSWGVTILEAARAFDSGAVWATHEFPLNGNGRAKSSLYRGLVTEAAVRGVLDLVDSLHGLALSSPGQSEGGESASASTPAPKRSRLSAPANAASRSRY